MTLLEVRTQTTKISGRYDLVVDAAAWADNGMDFYIRAGQQWMERITNIKNSDAKVLAEITSGDWYTLIQRARAIKRVWCSNAEGELWELEEIDYEILRAAYAEDPANLDGGDPLYYTPIYLRTVPEPSGSITIDQFGPTTYSEAGKDHWDYNGLLFMPPADANFTLKIEGYFYEPRLTLDADENYWTEVETMALVLATLRSLELSYRNTEGAKDWERAVQAELLGLDKDLVEEEIAQEDQMEG